MTEDRAAEILTETLTDIIDDAARLGDPGAAPELEALRYAILLEDVFAVTLTDAELDLSTLTSPMAVAELLRRRPRGAG